MRRVVLIVLLSMAAGVACGMPLPSSVRPSAETAAVPQPRSEAPPDSCKPSDTGGPVVETPADKDGFSVTVWPPDHTYRTLTVSDCIVSVQDACDGPLQASEVARMVRMTSDELSPGSGGDQTDADMVIDGPRTGRLRAVRNGGADGRVYTVHFSVVDRTGNATAAMCRVQVPRIPGTPAVESGVAACVGAGC